ncbi:MAG: PEP-CTERM sorting domain-containing protein [Pirellulales bacterium]
MDGYIIETNSGPNDLLRFDQISPNVVPEPGAATLFAVGLFALVYGRRWTRTRRNAPASRDE